MSRDLIDAINDCIRLYNKNPRLFQWVPSASNVALRRQKSPLNVGITSLQAARTRPVCVLAGNAASESGDVRTETRDGCVHGSGYGLTASEDALRIDLGPTNIAVVLFYPRGRAPEL